MKGVNVNEVKQAEVALENTVKTYSTENDPAQADGIHDITDEQVITAMADEFDITYDESCALIRRVAANLIEGE